MPARLSCPGRARAPDPRPESCSGGARRRSSCGCAEASRGHAGSATRSCASMELVASSRMTILGFARKARRKQTSWRCPTESPEPRSPTWVSSPSGISSSTSRQPSLLGRLDDLGLVAPGLLRQTFSSTEPLKRKFCCCTIPICWWSDPPVIVRISRPSTRTSPFGRKVELGDKVYDRALSAAGVADERYRLARARRRS